jgi:hypothetical protein
VPQNTLFRNLTVYLISTVFHLTCTKTLRILAFVYKANLDENFTSVSACESEALEAWEDLDLELNLRSPCSNRSEILL